MNANLIDEIDALLSEAQTVKSAEAAASQGVVQNQGDTGTTHPSKSIDDGNQDATEGARSAENTADVKSDVPGQSVDSAKEDRMKGESEHPLTTAKPTGEDPANETSSVDGLIGGEAGKDHQGKDTSHPAKVDFDGKYASWQEAADDVENVANACNNFHAKIAALNFAEVMVPASARLHKNQAKPISAKEAADEAAGEKAAEVAVEQLTTVPDNTAQVALINQLAKEAIDDADRYVDFCAGLVDGFDEQNNTMRTKEAKDFASTLHGGVSNAVGRMFKASVGPGGMGIEGEADNLAMGGEGEAPNEAMEDELPPEMGGGAPPTDPEAGDEELTPDIIEQIAAELEQAGVDPEVLMSIPPEALAEALTEAGAAEGGMPGGEMGGPPAGPGGGMPPMGPEGGPPMEEMAAPELNPEPAM